MEGLARLFVSPVDVLVHEQHENVIDVLGLPSLNATMEFDPYLFWRLKSDLNKFRVTGRIRDSSIDFSVTTEGLFRTGFQHNSSGNVRILALGDSTTFGLGVDDHHTWPAQLRDMLEDLNLGVDITNAGVPGYTAFQGVRMLEQHGLLLNPDIVVATFGFNDSDSWSLDSDTETARKLSIRQWELRLMRSRFYSTFRRWFRSMLDETGVSKAAASPSDAQRSDAGGRATGSKPRQDPEEFYRALKSIQALTDRQDIRLLMLIWPYASQQNPNTPDLYGYQQLTARFCQNEDVTCVNLVEVFRQSKTNLFVDHFHANVEGCRVAAEALVPIIRQIIHGQTLKVEHIDGTLY
jgi:lysophospholipase L1-like esterase